MQCSTGRSAADLPAAVAVVDGWVKWTDGRKPDCYIGLFTGLHTMRASGNVCKKQTWDFLASEASILETPTRQPVLLF